MAYEFIYSPLVVDRNLWADALSMSVTTKRSMKQRVLLQLQSFGFSLDSARAIVSIVGYDDALPTVHMTRTIVQNLVYRGVRPGDAAQVLKWVIEASNKSKGHCDSLAYFISGSFPSVGQVKQRRCALVIATALLTDAGMAALQHLGNRAVRGNRHPKKTLRLPKRLQNNPVGIVKWIFRNNVQYNNLSWSGLKSDFYHHLVTGNVLLLKGAKAEWERCGGDAAQHTLERVLGVMGHSGFADVPGDYWDNIGQAIRMAEEDWRQVVP